MLLRITPDMFQDERYGCVTIQEVRDELFSTQKFKSKYPWRTDYKDRVKTISPGKIDKASVDLYFSAIDALNMAGTVNKKSIRLFDLSLTDKKVLSNALAHGFKITSGDRDLIQFARQEFREIFKGNLSPLEIINMWLEKGLLVWDDMKHEYLAEWERLEEPHQPIKAIGKFQQLTGKRYPGS